MRLTLVVLALVAGCTYNQTDQAALTALQSRIGAVEQRQDALEGRVSAQGDAIQTLRTRMSPYK